MFSNITVFLRDVLRLLSGYLWYSTVWLKHFFKNIWQVLWTITLFLQNTFLKNFLQLFFYQVTWFNLILYFLEIMLQRYFQTLKRFSFNFLSAMIFYRVAAVYPIYNSDKNMKYAKYFCQVLYIKNWFFFKLYIWMSLF